MIGHKLVFCLLNVAPEWLKLYSIKVSTLNYIPLINLEVWVQLNQAMCHLKYTCTPSMDVMGSGGSGVQSHLQLHRKFKTSLSYKRSCLKKLVLTSQQSMCYHIKTQESDRVGYESDKGWQTEAKGRKEVSESWHPSGELSQLIFPIPRGT